MTRRLLFLGIAFSAIGCAEVLPLDGRHCPCASGYHCCESGNVCVPRAKECPRWRSLDPVGLNAIGISPTFDFKIAADGAPHIAGLTCDAACNEQGGLGVPFVARYVDDSWVTLTQEGLPRSYFFPLLLIGRDGTLHLLSDGMSSSFDGTTWAQRFPPVPGDGLAGSTVVEDEEGRIVTTIREDTDGSVPAELSVVRLEGSTWTALGSKLPGELNLNSLVVRDETLCIAHVHWYETGYLGPLSCFDGSEWATVKEFQSNLAGGVGIGPDGAFYVAPWDGLLMTVMEGKRARWSEIGSLFATHAQLAVSKNRTVFVLVTSLERNTSMVAAWRPDTREWSYYTTEGLDGSVRPLLAIGDDGDEPVPYLAYQIYDPVASFKVVKHE